MLARYVHNGIVWVDLESPTREEVLSVVEEFHIESSVAEELLQPTAKPRCERHDGQLYIIMHFPALRHSHKTKEQEIDFVVGRKYLVTVHYDTVDALHKFSKVFEVNSVLDKSSIGDHAGYLFFYILKKLYKAVDHEISVVSKDLASVEEQLFSGNEVALVETISMCARDLLHLRQTIEPHRDVLESLGAESVTFFGDRFAPFARAASHEYYRVHSHIIRHSEVLRELRTTNDSLLTTKQNETLKVLSIMALFTFPLALLVATLDSRLHGNPFEDKADGFSMLIVLMSLIAVVMYIYFRRKRWL